MLYGDGRGGRERVGGYLCHRSCASLLRPRRLVNPAFVVRIATKRSAAVTGVNFLTVNSKKQPEAIYARFFSKSSLLGGCKCWFFQEQEEGVICVFPSNGDAATTELITAVCAAERRHCVRLRVIVPSGEHRATAVCVRHSLCQAQTWSGYSRYFVLVYYILPLGA